MEKKAWKVLLVEDNPGDVRLMREYLKGAGEPGFLLEVVGELAVALPRLDQGSIDAVLLDLHLPDSRGLETLGAVRQHAPQTPIILLTSLDDEELAERAVREGAQDYLVKGQVNAAQVVRAIRYAVARQASAAERAGSRQNRIIAFMGAKGGVGTTTVALNVAAALARQNPGVVLVELHHGPGSLSGLLQASPAANLGHLLRIEAARIGAAELTARMTRLPSGLRLLFGPQSAEEYGEIQADQARAIIDCLARQATYLLLDLPGGPSAANQVAVESSDYAVVVLEPEPLSLRGAKATLEMLESWGVGSRLIGAVVVNRGFWGEPLPVRDICQQLGCDVVGAILPGGDALRSALRTGLPLVLARPESNAAAGLSELAARLTQEPVPALST